MSGVGGGGQRVQSGIGVNSCVFTCFILTPHMDPLTSMTNTMFLGRGERLDGAKNWTKWPSET